MADLETYTKNLQAALKSMWRTQPDPVYVCFEGTAGHYLDTPTICGVAMALGVADAWVAAATDKKRWYELQPVLVGPT